MCCAIHCVRQGVWRFAIVSVAGFAVWAFAGSWLNAHGGEVGLYAVNTVIIDPVTRYKPDILWADGEWDGPDTW